MQDLAQIQIVPVEDGFFIQVINSDGSGAKNPRHVASTREELVEKIKKLAEGLFTQEPPKPQVPGQPGAVAVTGPAASVAQPQSPPPPS